MAFQRFETVTEVQRGPSSSWLVFRALEGSYSAGLPGLAAVRMGSESASAAASTVASTVASTLAVVGVQALLLMVVMAAGAWCALAWWRRYAHFRRLELAMPGPPSLPILGNALAMLGINEDNSFAKALELWGGRSTELSRCSLFNYLLVFVSDPDHIGKVVRDKRFNDKPWLIYSPMGDVLGQGLVTSSGAYWKRHRVIVQPTFHLEILERFVDVFAEEAGAFVQRMRPLLGRDVEFAEEMHHSTAASVVRTTMSSEIEEHDKHDYDIIVSGVTSCLKTVNLRSLRPWLWPTSLFNLTAMGREQARFLKRTDTFMNSLIDRKTAEILAKKDCHASQLEGKLGFKERKTFLDLVLEAKLSGQVEMTREEIRGEMKTIFGTAVETSVTALTFVFKMLSIRPDVQQRVFAEVCDVMQGSNRPVNVNDLTRLEYMERVIKETLRIFPIGPFVGRQVNEETELCGKVIPAGAVLIVNIFSAHRDPRHHPDPLHFDPDRFLPERTASWHPHCFMPFSAGPRNCIGQRYAMMQMKTILTTTLRAYRLEPADDGITHPSQFPLTFDIALRLVGGTKVRFEPRAPVAVAAA